MSPKRSDLFHVMKLRTGLALALAMVAGQATALDRDVLDSLEFHHGIAFYHELKYPSDFKHFDYVNPEAPKGGTWVETIPFKEISFNTLTPNRDQGIPPWQAGPWTLDSLIVRAGDEPSAFYARLAESVAVTPDQRALVFRIHPEARWHDGVPITSRDIAFTVKSNKSQAVSGAFYGFIDRVEEIDERLVALHLAEELTVRTLVMLHFMYIMPAHYWAENDPTVVSLEKIPVGSGPYRISSIRQGRHIEYERVPEYWGRDLPVHRGLYNFDVIRYDVYRDATIIREALRKGLVDAWTEPDLRYWHSAFDTPAFEKGWLKKMRRNFGIEIGPQWMLSFNLRREKFQDRRVRKALALALNYNWQNQTLHFGEETRATSYFQGSELAAVGLPSENELELLEPFRDQLPREVFTRPLERARIETQEDHRLNLLQARELLLEAGWKIVDGRLQNEAGEVFEIEFLTRSREDARTLLPYFRDLKRLGIGADIRFADGSQYVSRWRNFDFDALVRDSTILLPPVIELRSTFHSDSAMVPMARNEIGIKNPAVDFLIGKAEVATTMDQAIAATWALDRVLMWNHYEIPLNSVARKRTIYWDKFGQPEVQPKYWPPFPSGWWFDAEKAERITMTSE